MAMQVRFQHYYSKPVKYSAINRYDTLVYKINHKETYYTFFLFHLTATLPAAFQNKKASDQSWILKVHKPLKNSRITGIKI